MSAQPVSLLGGYAGPPPILVVGSSDSATRRASAVIEAAGYRAAPVDMKLAPDRIELQPAASGIWLELDNDHGPMLDRLVDQLKSRASSGSCPGIISAPFDLIDPLEAMMSEPGIELLIDPGAGDRATALARLASLTKAKNEGVYDDVARDSGDARLRQLSDEISRIAATLSRLSTGPGPAPVENMMETAGDAPPVSLETIRQVIRARRLRGRYFDEELFADPAWDMLLDLLQAEIAQHRVPVSSLCIAAAVPPTTALRWIKSMTDAGLFNRRADPHDGRRVFVELAPQASEALRRYFAEVGRAAIV
ncbi:MAG TPA: MarR family winged helix-turn-helix transcriptional regulator [Sphingomicrobium sp.]|nr:MarR family winged helix-turn-helix transcriptional regulator [Sphingomicrobium sp.]